MTANSTGDSSPYPNAARSTGASAERILASDRAHVWHPYTPADRHEAEPPLVVASARGSSFFGVDGRAYLDGNASWWTMGLGHSHPRLVEAIREQSEIMAHVAFAGTAHEQAAELACELVEVAPRAPGKSPSLTRVFYTDNGSTAIEAAVRMALQGQAQRGHGEKTRFVALDGAFHGETLGAASLGGVELFRRALGGVTFECVRAPVTPRGPDFDAAFAALKTLMRDNGNQVAAVFVEPIVQGASGMRNYAPELLAELRAQCNHFGAWLCCDEVFAGYGRTGPMWASEHAGVVPDLMCLGKTFAAPMPFGAVMATEEIYNAFRGDASRALFYGHTFAGHALGARVAREVLAIFRDEDILGGIARKAPVLARAIDRIGAIAGVARTRHIGMIAAADLAVSPEYSGHVGWRVYKEALARGAYIRPLGDTVYLCPPLNITEPDLVRLVGVFEESIAVALR